MTPRPLSTENIYWKDVRAHNTAFRDQASRKYQIIDRGSCWEAHRDNVPVGVIYWLGEEAREAQKYLHDNQMLNKKDVDPEA